MHLIISRIIECGIDDWSDTDSRIIAVYIPIISVVVFAWYSIIGWIYARSRIKSYRQWCRTSLRRDFCVGDDRIFGIHFFDDIAEWLVAVRHERSNPRLIIRTSISYQSLSDIETLLIGYLKSKILRKFWKHHLETRVELREFCLRDLRADFGCSLYLHKQRKDLVVICLDLIVCNIVVGDTCANLPDKQDSS